MSTLLQKRAKLLPEIIRAAFGSRCEFAKNHPAYRLFNGRHDGWDGLEIEIYGDVVLIRTLDIDTDSLLPTLIQILNELLAPASILLKNRCNERSRLGLELSDLILWGKAPARPMVIKEAGRNYLYDPDDADFFPLADRPLRNWAATTIETPADSILSLGPSRADLIFADSKISFTQIKTHQKSLTDVTVALRNLSNPEKGFSLAAVDTGFVGNVTKNKKALYHLSHHLFKKLAPRSHLIVKSNHLKDFLGLWKNLTQKTGWKMTLLQEQGAARDFARKIEWDETRKRVLYAQFILEN